MQWFDNAKSIVMKLTDLGVTLLALAIVLQILFGSAMPFLGGDIVSNLIAFIGGLGNNGLVGLVAIGAVIWILTRR
ncbi:MAG: hypothetical protein FJX51_02035 [Alphaproteobacteria bacterium]|jgi:hypothetical protein|nr:hypothetical protein [Alphaproteobacteria bacterium]